MRLYKPKYLGTIASLVGHTESTFKDYYKNPRLPLKDAEYFLESIRPETIWVKKIARNLLSEESEERIWAEYMGVNRH